MFIKAPRRSREQMQRILDLRSSSAASKHRNRKKYTRKVKHRGRES